MRPVRLALAGVLGVLAIVTARKRTRRYEIAEESMAPALHTGDYVIAVSRRVARRSDIVIFDHPEQPGFELVKRVVGLPGDRVTITDGRVLIDGEPLVEPWASGVTRGDGEWTLGTDQIFVLGDNRAFSTSDSRSIGPIRTSAAVWRVALRYWPIESIGQI